MLGSKTHEIISILYDVDGAGHCCEEVAVRIQLLMFQGPGPPSLAFATELALPAKYGENASFGHNFCVNRLILKNLMVLESACLIPKLMKLSRYHMTYMAPGIAAKKLRCEGAYSTFDVPGAPSSMLGVLRP